MTVQQSFDEFILSRRLADLSQKTISNYIQFITPFVSFLGSNTPLEDVTQEHITRYQKTLLNKPISKATKATYIRHVKVFLKWCAENQETNYNYKKVKVPKPPKKNVKIYTTEELLEMLDNVQAENDWLTMRNKCILALMYDSGLRQSEVCTLELARVSFTERRMVVHGKGNKERTVPLGALTSSFMRQYLDMCPYKSKNVFVSRRGEPLTCNAVKLMVSRLSNKTDINVSSHKLRHNFATNYCIDQYEEHGQVDIYRLMIIMGHEDIETTRRYLHHANEIIGTKNCISHLDKLISGEN